jgi:hypothetical protein
VKSSPHRPVWSGALTEPLARRVPAGRRPIALTIIRAVHTIVFFSVAALIALVVADGLRGRPKRRTAVATGVAVIEAAVFLSNNLVCPLTPLAEALGAESGSVTDVYLPEWLSRQIPILSGTALVLGMALNLRAWLTSRRRWNDREPGSHSVPQSTQPILKLTPLEVDQGVAIERSGFSRRACY